MSSILKIKTLLSFENSVNFYQIIRRHIPFTAVKTPRPDGHNSNILYVEGAWGFPKTRMITVQFIFRPAVGPCHRPWHTRHCETADSEWLWWMGGRFQLREKQTRSLFCIGCVDAGSCSSITPARHGSSYFRLTARYRASLCLCRLWRWGHEFRRKTDSCKEHWN